jgi:acetyl esterase/lipase
MRVRRVLTWTALGVTVLAGIVAITAYWAIGTFAVKIPASLKGDHAGAIVAVERTCKYPRFVVQRLLDSVDLPNRIDVTSGITTYRLRYRSTNYDGTPVTASALVGLPNRSTLTSVVIYLHGTMAQRSIAPSRPGLGEGVLVAAAASGMGHVLVAPDYIGLGESHELHPYLHAQATATACIDCLRAAKALVEHLCGRCPSSLYIMGFSQGGHAALAVQRVLEQDADSPFTVKASAPIAGPFHLREISLPHALTGTTDSHAFYLAYLASAYARIYGQPLETLLTAPYVEKVPVLFDGDHGPAEIAAAMPKTPRDLFSAGFLDAYDHGRPHWFLAALAENGVNSWTPAAPVRIYYGEADLDVSPEEARSTEAEMRQRGANVSAISVGRVSHNVSAMRAIPQALHWFTELVNKKGE